MGYQRKPISNDVMLCRCVHISLSAHRFNGRNCGFPASTQALSQLESLMPLPATPGGDSDQQTHFEELQRQSGLTPSQQWESAVENYITLKNMANF